MNRTNLLKFGYLLVLLALGLCVSRILGGVSEGSARTQVALLVIVCLLVPGRLSGLFFRNLYRSRRAFAKGDFEQAAQNLVL